LLWDSKRFYLEWLITRINSVDLIGVIILDYMSCIFMSVVLFISGFVVIYSERYMRGDKRKVRFILIVLMFVLSISLLILRPNIVRILLG